jgi:hypothetical protein
MRIASMAVAGILSVCAVFGQEQAVERSNIWVDTVRRGDMPVMVRGRGVLGANKTAELKMPGELMKQVETGQRASIDTGQGVIEGKVARVGPAEVVIALEGALPASAHPGLAVDGTIHMAVLKDVAYVGRPVLCNLNGDGSIFKLELDGQHATRVKVGYGKGSVNLVEVRSGLKAGDRVILTDMSAYDGKDRVRVE